MDVEIKVPLRLTSSRFQEPMPKSKAARQHEEKVRRMIKPRRDIWEGCILALGDLARMVRMEIIIFKKRIFRWD